MSILETVKASKDYLRRARDIQGEARQLNKARSARAFTATELEDGMVMVGLV
jgi:predicted LPLAT superfamily acyltransferase